MSDTKSPPPRKRVIARITGSLSNRSGGTATREIARSGKSGNYQATYKTHAATMLNQTNPYSYSKAGKPSGLIKKKIGYVTNLYLQEAKLYLQDGYSAKDEAQVVRLARSGELARADPGQDVTDLSDEDFLARLRS